MTNTGMFELCYLYYDEKTMEHAKRVANKAQSIYRMIYLYTKEITGFYPGNISNFIYQLGLAHDLYEDTKIKQGVWFEEDFEENLQLLTKEKDVNYNDYIAKIHKMAIKNPKYMPAYIVKLADMHDHFAQVDTLTDKLKNKYTAAMPYLI